MACPTVNKNSCPSNSGTCVSDAAMEFCFGASGSCPGACTISVAGSGSPLPPSGPDGGVVYDDGGIPATSVGFTYDPTATTCPNTGATLPLPGLLTVPNLEVTGMIDPIGVQFTMQPSDPEPTINGTVWVRNGNTLMLDNMVVGDQKSVGIDYCMDIQNGATPYNVDSSTYTAIPHIGSQSATNIVGTPIQVGTYYGCPVYRAYFYGEITNGALTGSIYSSNTVLGPLPQAATCIVDSGGSWVGGNGITYQVGFNSLASYVAAGQVVNSGVMIKDGQLTLQTFDGTQTLTGVFIGAPIIQSYIANRRDNAPYFVWVDYTTCSLATLAQTQC